MQQIISNPDGSKIKLEYQIPVTKIRIIYAPSKGESGKEIEKAITIKKEA